ncbi:Error-prone repair protein ImuA [Mucilaginibacter sp.]|jgi:protein ImuA|uniref:ImuA family protein n=1 Tax=Mucilaginibacter sp. TaxID=1882438 RepID=UPI002C7D6213|nr:Error-prone repair protein ImuA [Mucilaginibacter sp.]HTI61777.1 hypothetical protein [Mucilaginibacter sp.]
MQATRQDTINKLRKDILLWEGFKPPALDALGSFGLGSIEGAFPNGVFPVGAIHEMLCPTPEHLAASTGFMAGVVSALASKGGVCLWISRYHRLFPPSLMFFNMPPHHIIFVDVNREKDILWVMEEALKCEGLTAVIAELQTITFAQSRRLQLAVERSKVTGFILHNNPQKAGASTCVARWQVTSLSSEIEGGLPGIGFPRWQVELLKVRNGKPGNWTVSWDGNGFNIAEEEPDIIQLPGRKAG